MENIFEDYQNDVFYKLENNVFKNKFNEIELNDLNLIKNAHKISSNDSPLGFFLHKVFQKGSFLQKDRTYIFSTCIFNDRLSFSCVEETIGWGKNEDAFMIVYLDEILEVSASSNFYLNIEKTKPNSLFIPNDPSFSISEANSKCLTFYLNENNFYLNVHPLYFSEEFPIDFFNSLIKQYQELTTEIQDKNFLIINTIKELNDNKKYKELNQYLDENKSDISSFTYKIYKIYSLIGLNDLENAKLFFKQLTIEKESELNNENIDENISYYIVESKILDSEGKSYEAAFSYYNAKELCSNLKNKNYQYHAELENNIHIHYNNFIDNFDKINPKERQLITISNTNDLFKGDYIKLLNINNLPNIQFPTGHPKRDNTYICHPHNSNIYLHFNNYEKDLLADRIDEYCYLLQCLGATSIIFENTKTDSKIENSFSESKIDFETNIPNEGLTNLVKLKTDTENSSKANKFDKIASKFGRTQIFNPSKKPFVPEGLVWFPFEMSWQRIANQRLNGNLLTHNEIISNSQNKILGQEELNDIKGELSVLSDLFKLKGGKFDKNTVDIDINFHEELKISVIFKPLDEFDLINKKTDNFIEENLSNDDNDAKYIQEVKFMLEDDGVIDDKERTILERFRKTFNIAEDRALELEQQLFDNAKFTEEENKYIDEVKFMLEDDGIIDDKERVILERFRKTFNITEERALELEQLILSSTNNIELNDNEKEYLEEYTNFISNDEVITEKERRILNRLANLLNISEDRIIEIENSIN